MKYLLPNLTGYYIGVFLGLILVVLINDIKAALHWQYLVISILGFIICFTIETLTTKNNG